MQMRHNLSRMQEWIREHHIDDSIIETLQPIIQAVYLLQASKSDDSVELICSTFPQLNPAQILHILHLYVPANKMDKRTPTSVTEKLQDELKRKRPNSESQPSTRFVDTKFTYGVTFPFRHSFTKLEVIVVPPVLNLHVPRKVLTVGKIFLRYSFLSFRNMEQAFRIWLSSENIYDPISSLPLHATLPHTLVETIHRKYYSLT